MCCDMTALLSLGTRARVERSLSLTAVQPADRDAEHAARVAQEGGTAGQVAIGPAGVPYCALEPAAVLRRQVDLRLHALPRRGEAPHGERAARAAVVAQPRDRRREPAAELDAAERTDVRYPAAEVVP